ncbi:hypothetical protein FAEPRAA2165_02862 [Faecalibacterium duncaniae]|uniref:Uncharacterized protein n=1 Tax=Faecalibacterium duncaniae (strain DSM 17677 / JCM 31915 / A2-165) TaxID=411483 RepID=C7H964_FAED2|nr:hypothetical protein FAEPRAA2165_02862 [Faecalibacterium duncaniae]
MEMVLLSSKGNAGLFAPCKVHRRLRQFLNNNDIYLSILFLV